MALKNRPNLEGRKFGSLTALEYIGINQYRSHIWLCKCDCGNDIIVTGSRLLLGDKSSCGCIAKSNKLRKLEEYRNEFVGKRFGRLIVDSRDFSDKSTTRFNCTCDCGNKVKVLIRNLSHKITASCGCYARDKAAEAITKHGLSHHPLYHTWNGMIQRCHNPNAPNYKYYGARGISVCEEWRDSIHNFVEWANSNGHREGLTLDRIDNNKGYSPDNCRWATVTEQNRNQSTTKLDLEKVNKIRNDTRPNVIIAKEYDIYPGHVGNVKSKLIWKDT